MKFVGVSKSFIDRANEAAYWEAWVGAVLARAGLYTLHHPFTADGSDQHGHSWDLDVAKDGLNPPIAAGPWIPTEVKSLSITFHNPKDYPYPGLLVCSKNSFERKWPEAKQTMRDFLFVSRPTGAVLWLPVLSPVKKVTVTDTKRNETYAAMQSEKKLLMPLQAFVEYIYAKA